MGTIRKSLFAFLLLAFALVLSACTPTQPVAKVALLAPFEGVYRQEGYDALASLRAAIAEQCPGRTNALPLALDTSYDVTRTVQKALADPSVVAVIGPYWAADAPAIPTLTNSATWLSPYAPGDRQTWLADVVQAARSFPLADGRRLYLAGIPPGWPQTDAPLLVAPADAPTDAVVLWLGDATFGADFALALWDRLPGAPFGLVHGGAETFRQRVGARMDGPVFLVGWIDADYPAWATNHFPNTPAAYVIYQQTAHVLCGLSGETRTPVWKPAIFHLGDDGSLRLSSGH